MKRNMRYLVYALAMGLLVALTATSAFAAKQELIVFHAGSLSTPMAAIEEAYEKANPDVDILREAGGSAALARKIIDLDGKCDAYFSTDYLVIERLLRPDFVELYETAEVERADKGFGKTIITKGCPIIYGRPYPKEPSIVKRLSNFSNTSPILKAVWLSSRKWVRPPSAATDA
jgi:hypothetical protein